ncbi:MAG: gfo/Idh/MocA family oxidoreductase [Bacteroidota bacterium]|jgi:predicted dehydrogenase
MHLETILLVGSGNMASEYLKVLNAMNKKVIVVGRGESNINKLKSIYPQFEYHSGGIENYLRDNTFVPEIAINVVNIDLLGCATSLLINAGLKKILIEKPGDLTIDGLSELKSLSEEKKCNVVIGYNRRFYSSVTQLIHEVIRDGGIKSCHFEFTEWTHTFGLNTHSKAALNRWILSNSSHVIDTAFFLIGKPSRIYPIVSGFENILWHPSGSIFVGAGVSINNVPFTYHANWIGPGRWGIEIITSKRRFFLRPMEALFYQPLGSVEINQIPLDDSFDNSYKPGLFRQVESFCNSDFSLLQTIGDQLEMMSYYESIAGYK